MDSLDLFNEDLGAYAVDSNGPSAYTPSETRATCGSQSNTIASSQPVQDPYFVSYNTGVDVDAGILTADSFDQYVDLAGLNESLQDLELSSFGFNGGYALRPSLASETGATCGSLSTMTTSSVTDSSDDINDTLSFYSTSTSYGPPPPDDHSFPLDVNTKRLADEVPPDIGTTQLGTLDPRSFGPLPPVHVPHNVNSEKMFSTCSSSSSFDYRYIYHSPPSPSLAQTTVSPFQFSLQHAINQRRARKYICPTCNSAFGRKFNLKIHRLTHDPNRVKPYACHLCGRPFTRKNDLARHLASVHKGNTGTSSSFPKKKGRAARTGIDIGINQGGPRERCNTCGKSRVSLGSNPISVQCECSYDVE
ncbi:hypothetical protein BDN72DRAFT_851021 [Pluteus cervinus]|uniref:Uncharacterized protein n=1 Tax=Pluteus cervinus TaxID=181527 RepID=A0ACD3A2Q0_9AGAR|nr:hypothetical protein BDN72DRAFT_851021 [Pluteus cervinus]